MKILAHRGYWNENIERNSSEALKAALTNGFGFESDIRDYKGELVISHNVADDNCVKASEIFKILGDYSDKYCFAVNIKADGLIDLLRAELNKFNISNYFAFDMSVPQMIEYSEANIRFFTRQSEFEATPVLYEKSCGVWIDAFYNYDWIDERLIGQHLDSRKSVCIVSPELHGKEYLAFWEKLRGFGVDSEQLMLCTDVPDKAAKFFER